MSLRSAVIKLAHSNPELREHLLPLLGQNKIAKVFPSQQALTKYLDQHPGADKKNHSVAEGAGDKAPSSKKILNPSHDGQNQSHEVWSNHHMDAADSKARARRKFQADDPERVKIHNEYKAHLSASNAHQKAKETPTKENSAEAHRQTSRVNNEKKWHPDVHHTMLKHSLHDEDADQLKKFKGNKPNHGTPISDQVLMQRFLSKAKPETKERMKGMSVADFKKMYAAINADEE